MSAERKTDDGVPVAQARATPFPRSTLIQIAGHSGFLGVIALLSIAAVLISPAFF